MRVPGPRARLQGNPLIPKECTSRWKGGDAHREALDRRSVPRTRGRDPGRRAAQHARSRPRWPTGSATRGTGSPSITPRPRSRARPRRSSSTGSRRRPPRSASARAPCCCPTTARSRSRRRFGCSTRSTPTGSISGSDARPAAVRSRPTRCCATGSGRCRTIFPSSWWSCWRSSTGRFRRTIRSGRFWSRRRCRARRRSGSSAPARGARTPRPSSGCPTRSPTSSTPTRPARRSTTTART